MSRNSRDTTRSSRPHLRLNSNPNDLLAPANEEPRPSPRRPLRPPLPFPIRTTHTESPREGPDTPSSATSDTLLIPPRPRSRQKRYRDRSRSPTQSPIVSPPSASSSRRSSVSSQSGLLRNSAAFGTSAFGPYHDAFGNDSVSSSRAGSRRGSISEDEKITTQTAQEKFTIMPSAGMKLFPGDAEDDDWLHNPTAEDYKVDRDMHFTHMLNRRGALNLGGLSLIIFGILLLFIGAPLLAQVQKVIYPYGMQCADDPDCIRNDLPLLQNVRTGVIDPDTPRTPEIMTRTARDGSTMKLVFSDEFNTPGRSFYENDDAYWQGVNLWYGATNDIEWYDEYQISTGNGTLNIDFAKFASHGLDYRSGMLQSWNKMCFKGGYIEASISLPGRGDVIGFWPGFWTMGNLGRPGYLATADGMWPYSYHHGCDHGITPNQSSTDGLSWLPGMRLPACSCPGQEHPSPGKSRSAPEIDALEASTVFLGEGKTGGVGSLSQSYQLAPFDVWYQPNYDFVEVYNPKVTEMNPYRGGPWQQAFSGLSNLNNDWYDGKAYQTYSFEYEPGAAGYCKWYIGKDATWALEGASLGANGNVGPRTLPEEPMSIIANFGMSPQFSEIDTAAVEALMPATMRIDYIRVYQREGDELTCDPVGFPTTDYIEAHPKAYKNPEKIKWRGTGYDWPTNDYMNDCKAGAS